MPQKAPYVYELRSINLGNLPENEQARVLDQFASFLNSLADPVTFEAVKDVRRVAALGASYEVPYMRFFVTSDSQIDELLGGLLGTNKFVRVPSAPSIEISHVSSRYVMDAQSQFVQTFNITRLGGAMETAFLTRVYGTAHSVRLQLLPVEPYQARALSRGRARALRSALVLRQLGGWSFNPEREAELQRVQAAAQLIAAGAERLFRAKVSIRLREKTYPELASARRKLRQALGGVVEEMDSPRFLQEAFLTGKGPTWATGRWFYLTTSAATTFFPFAGLDIVDPTGVFLGQSLQTGGAIVYDVFDRENYNMAIMGQTGFGKCLAENSLVVLDDGRYLPIHKIVSGSALSLNDDLKIETQKIVRASKRALLSNERMLKVTTRSGRVIELTADHPILTLPGWKRAGALVKDERIAVPRIIPVFGIAEIPSCQVKILAYLITEGSLSQTQKTPGFTNTDPQIVQDMRAAIAEFSKELALKPRSRFNRYDYEFRISKKDSCRNSLVANPLTQWLKSLGVFGCDSYTKFVPEVVFTLRRPLLALFLNRLFSGDGCLRMQRSRGKSPVPVVSYASNSNILIHQVQHLLLRFGILSYVRDRTRGGFGYELWVTGQDDVKRFLYEIGFFGARSKLEVTFPSTQVGSADNIPKEVWARIERGFYSLGRERGLTKQQIRGLYTYRKRNPSRQVLLRIAGNDPLAAKYATSDIFWDAVKKVEKLDYAGFVYDLSLPVNHNFVAQDFFVHNSTFVKTLFSRMLLTDPNMCAFVFDSIVKPEYSLGPDGKRETSFAGITGCHVHRFLPDKGAGLDPFAVFPDRRRAANFLASVAKIEDEPDLMADLYLASAKAASVDDLMAKAEGELRKRLQANITPYSFLFEGELSLYPRMVFVLYDLPPGELRDAAAFLSLSAVWKSIQDTSVFPVSRRKSIIIDEGWALVEINPRTGKPYFPLAVEYVPEIARTARHYNANFTLATQLVSDLMGRGGSYGPGRAMVESCATKVVLKQDQAASATLKEAFNLSGVEERFVTNAKIGQGLLLTQEGHLPFNNFLSDLEQKLFTTRPKDVTA